MRIKPSLDTCGLERTAFSLAHNRANMVSHQFNQIYFQAASLVALYTL